MAHFTVMVIGDNPEEQLAKFNENLEVPPYILYTRQQLIEMGKAEIESYKAMYADYLEDPQEYAKRFTSTYHIQFMEKELPKRFQWTNHEILEYSLKWFSQEDIDENKNILSRQNPNAKLDAYTLKSRFTEGVLKIKDCALVDFDSYEDISKINVAYKEDIENFDTIFVSAVVKDGIWHEKPYTGYWWEMLIGEEVKDNYKEVGEKICSSIPEDTLISIFACHI